MVSSANPDDLPLDTFPIVYSGAVPWLPNSEKAFVQLNPDARIATEAIIIFINKRFCDI
jgi:hypothetical protein